MSAPTKAKSAPRKSAASKPAAKTSKAAAAKPASSKPAASKSAAKPVAAKAAKSASKSAASKSPKAARVDLLAKHISEAFSGKPKGTAMTPTELANAITPTFPTDKTRPPVTTLFGRIRDERLPEGIAAKTSPRSAVKS